MFGTKAALSEAEAVLASSAAGHDDPSEPPPAVYVHPGQMSANVLPMYHPNAPQPAMLVDGAGMLWQLVDADKFSVAPPQAPPGQWNYQRPCAPHQQQTCFPQYPTAHYPNSGQRQVPQSAPKQRRALLLKPRRARSHSNERTSEREAAKAVAEAAEWPDLQIPITKVDTVARCPPGSIWRDNARSKGSDTSGNGQAVQEERPKVKMCNAEVQCDPLPEATKPVAAVRQRWCDVPETNEPTVCKHCGLSSDAPICEVASRLSKGRSMSKGLPEVPMMTDLSAWGPANDWAWDHDQHTDDTDVRDEHPEKTAAIMSQLRQSPAARLGLPAAPSGPAPELPTSPASRLGLPAAPLAPAPLPPEETPEETPEAEASLPCPASPTTTAGSISPAPAPSREPPTSDGIENGDCELSGVRSIDLPVSAASCREELHQRLARLRKQFREVERLEVRAAQGTTLNADQCSKMARLGSSKQLQTKVKEVEALVEVSDSDGSKECSSPPSRTQSAPQRLEAPVVIPPQGPAKAANVRIQKPPAARPLNEPKEGRIKDNSAATSMQRSTAKRKAAGQKSAAAVSEALDDTTSQSCSVPFLLFLATIIAVFISIIPLVPELLQHPQLVALLGKCGQFQSDMLGEPERSSRNVAGFGMSWDASQPSDAGSHFGSLQVSKVVHNQMVETARGLAAAREVQKKVYAVRLRLARERNQAKRQLATRKALAAKQEWESQRREADTKLQQEEIQRWLAYREQQQNQQLEEMKYLQLQENEAAQEYEGTNDERYTGY